MPVVSTRRTHATADTLYTADAGYHSEVGLKALHDMGIRALIADNGMRQRDERFKDQAKHKTGQDPLHDKSEGSTKAKAKKPG
jgi:hypothetical protein